MIFQPAIQPARGRTMHRTIRDRVLDALRDEAEPVTTGALATDLGLTTGQAGMALHRCWQDGLVDRQQVPGTSRWAWRIAL